MLRSRTTLPHTALTLLLAAPLSCAPAEKEGQVSDPQGCRTVIIPADATSSSTAPPETSSSGSSDTTTATTGADTSTSAASSSTTEPASGPGTLPGETGLEAFCRRFVECGGTTYDAQSCFDTSLEYWGACPSRRAALDVFGSCMAELSCDAWSPDTYDPNTTPCAEEWADLGNSAPC